MFPTNGHRGNMVKKGLVPKDHMKENRRQLKEHHVKNRELQEYRQQKSDFPEPLFKLSQFTNVESRVYEEPNKAPYKELDPNFLRRGQSEKRQEEIEINNKMQRMRLEKKLAAESSARNGAIESPRKAELPTKPAKLAEKSNVNFISKNRVESVMTFGGNKQTCAKSVSKTKGDPHHEAYGRVPAYLENRKQQWAEEEEYRRANAPDPDCPKGMKRMPEQERVDTLNTLKASLKEASNQLSAMPFNIETPSMKKKQTNLEAKIKEIENAIGLFSRQKVYIAL